MAGLSQEQRMIVSSVRDLAESEFAADAGTWEGEFPRRNVELLAENGFLGLNVDEAYGGAGLSEFEAMLVIDAVGQVCPDTGYALNVQHFFPLIVQEYGSEAAKERYLPPIVEGRAMIATAISEPEAGSDVMSMETTVRETDGELVLNGQKTWVSDVRESEVVIVWTMFEGEGLGSVLVDLDADGLEVGEHFTNMAGHTQTQLFFEDVTVPPENVLVRGDVARQFEALNWERLGNAAMLNGMMAFAADRALEYASDRTQFDQPIVDFQGIEWKFAEMVKRLEASRSLAARAGQRARERGDTPDRLESSIATLFASESAEQLVSEALQIHGANGYQQGHPLEYLYRFVRGFRIGAGTDEIQRNQIAAVVKQRGIPTVE
ncbi:MAG: acyl-CoA dehydrogenase family protein [Halorientalis sp.]